MARSDRQPRRRLDPDARRAGILDAAAAAFADGPYAQVSISAIAARAGASDALLYRYFSGKEELYAEVVRLGIVDLAARQDAAVAALPSGASVRDRVREATLVYLDHISVRRVAWATPLLAPAGDPPAAAALRAQARAEYVGKLRAVLSPSGNARHDYALWGYFGFLDAACLRWVERGCPAAERWSLLESTLGALEGALGDWSG